jgi:hypothetical protein
MMLLLVGVSSCKEESPLDLIDRSAPAPAPVDPDEVQVTPLPGGALLKYTLPDDPNLLYVKLEYEIRPGVKISAKTSYYSDTVRVQGFGEAGNYTVYLYSVGRNEKESAPTAKTIQTLTPPVVDVFASLELIETFSGVKVFYTNPSEATLAIVLMADTVGNGVMELVETFYTKEPEGQVTCKGLPAVKATYSVYLRDRWDNKSATLTKELTPYFEQQIPKPYAEHPLPSDVAVLPGNGNYGPISMLWDDFWLPAWPLKGFTTFANAPFPQIFTVDLQCRAILSSFRLHHRAEYEYDGDAVREFELYGSGEAAPADDLLSGDWIKLGRYRFPDPPAIFDLPPGYEHYANHPLIPNPNVAFASAGPLFEIAPTAELPNPYVPVRYVRVRILKSCRETATSGGIAIGEFTLFGQMTP